MATIEVEGGEVRVHMKGLWDQFWSWTNTLKIPISHIEDVSTDPPERSSDLGWFDKKVGTHIPGQFAMGTFRMGDDVVFMDLHNHPERAIRLICTHEKCKKVIVELEGQDPKAVAEQIRAAIASARK